MEPGINEISQISGGELIHFGGLVFPKQRKPKNVLRIILFSGAATKKKTNKLFVKSPLHKKLLRNT